MTDGTTRIDQAITSLPIKDRPKTRFQSLRMISFNAFFFISIVLLHMLQLVALPLALLPATRKYYEQVITTSKGWFGKLLVLITQLFAPTHVKLTFGGDTKASDCVQYDEKGAPTLVLPERNVFMSNHQIYSDWIIVWSILYLSNLHKSIIIILKASLKWIPVLGPAMQMFNFIFLARSWDADRKTLEKSLAEMGHRAEAKNDPLTLLIFPEGTLISPEQKPKSAAFARKMGIEDTRYNLLPRSTGLLFCLRALAPHVKSLQLIDATIGYEGVKPWPQGYGQQYYTLQSTFGHGQAPPAVHVHLEIIALKDIPIGKVPEHLRVGENPPSPTEEERKVFDAWLLERWRTKDDSLGRFYKSGSFSDIGDSSQGILLPLELKTHAEVGRLGLLVVAGGLVLFTVVAIFISQVGVAFRDAMM